MTTLRFAADTADVRLASSATDVGSVVVANAATEQVVMFQRAAGGASYIERDDQSFGIHDGVATIALSKTALHVTLNTAGKRALKYDAVTIALELAADELEQLRDGLVAIFPELDVDASWKAKAKAKAKAKSKSPAKAKPKAPAKPVRYLDLSDKKLKTLPANVADMLELATVRLDRNPGLDLEHACAVLAKLPMRELSMTPTTTIPANLGELRGLTKLSITDLTIAQAVPASLGALTELRELYIASTAELTLPAELGELPNLEKHQIVAPRWNVPPGLFAAGKLTELGLNGADLRALPDDVTGMRALQSLYLSDVPARDLTRVLRAFARVPSLRYLQLASSRIPAEVGLYTAVTELRIVRDGDQPLILPAALWTLDRLEELDLGSNLLAILPADIGRLTALKTLSLFDCGLTSLPAELGDLAQLAVLNVSQNPRLANLPASLARNPALKIYR